LSFGRLSGRNGGPPPPHLPELCGGLRHPPAVDELFLIGTRELRDLLGRVEADRTRRDRLDEGFDALFDDAAPPAR
jgi:hypothetical protein